MYFFIRHVRYEDLDLILQGLETINKLHDSIQRSSSFGCAMLDSKWDFKLSTHQM